MNRMVFYIANGSLLSLSTTRSVRCGFHVKLLDGVAFFVESHGFFSARAKASSLFCISTSVHGRIWCCNCFCLCFNNAHFFNLLRHHGKLHLRDVNRQKGRPWPSCHCWCDQKTTSSSNNVQLVRSNELHPYSLLFCLCDLALLSLQTELLKLASNSLFSSHPQQSSQPLQPNKRHTANQTWLRALRSIWKGDVHFGLAGKKPWRLQKLLCRCTIFTTVQYAQNQQSNFSDDKLHFLGCQNGYFASGRMVDV